MYKEPQGCKVGRPLSFSAEAKAVILLEQPRASPGQRGGFIMRLSRRAFLVLAAGTAASGATRAYASENGVRAAGPSAKGVLVDLTQCVGCRKCEAACQTANQLPFPTRSFEDMKVLDTPRRPNADTFTVLNKIAIEGDETPVYVKNQCAHCVDPACVSACLVGAMRKQPDGPVTYDASRCLGCRYCMVACPFQIPAYEYADPLTPRVRKCNFCADKQAKGEVPACVKACPKEALLFGPREELLKVAHARLAGVSGAFRERPKYVPYVYGEHEVGGTSWLYISDTPFESLGFLALPKSAPPRLTESIQHGIFRYMLAPTALFGGLALVRHLFKPEHEIIAEATESSPSSSEQKINHDRTARG
ncbi:MAG: 4Fe-4S dicluster domain-containing protein [Myxococcales bacterium]|nr:MAG: 4Fe-4S dicluster domain-containing protein [Myxococcales bacterium]